MLKENEKNKQTNKTKHKKKYQHQKSDVSLIFYVIICLEFNPDVDVISDELEWSLVLHHRKSTNSS